MSFESIVNLPIYNPQKIYFNNLLNNETYDNQEQSNIQTDKINDSIELIAHRGLSSIAPENTIPAYIAAAEAGFKTVECDIEWTKDNVPVLLHDDTINRTARKSNGWKFIFPKKCSKCSFKELQKYDFGIWKNKEYKGTKIPTFNEILTCCKDYGLNLYVDLKESTDFNREKAQILIDKVKEAGLENNITWISFENDYLKIINDIMPEARIGYLSKTEPNNETIEILDNLKTDKNEVFLDIKYTKISEETSDLIENAGFDFESWTVNEQNQLNKMLNLDCKAITTDTITDSDNLFIQNNEHIN